MSRGGLSQHVDQALLEVPGADLVDVAGDQQPQRAVVVGVADLDQRAAVVVPGCG